MTVEHRLHFGLADILAVTCECNNCKVRVSTKIDKLKVAGLWRCPSCAHEWFSDETVKDDVYTAPMARLISALPKVLTNETALGCKFILEFADPGPR